MQVLKTLFSFFHVLGSEKINADGPVKNRAAISDDSFLALFLNRYHFNFYGHYPASDGPYIRALHHIYQLVILVKKLNTQLQVIFMIYPHVYFTPYHSGRW